MGEKHTCCGLVWGGFRHHGCGKGAKYEHEGKWYCKTHHPPTAQARSEARNAKWKAEWDAQCARTKAANDAAAEQKRRADCYDQLVERVKELEEALLEARSVLSSVCTSRHRRVVEDGVVLYTQTEDWCRWAEGEVLDKVRAALSKPLSNTVAETPK